MMSDPRLSRRLDIEDRQLDAPPALGALLAGAPRRVRGGATVFAAGDPATSVMVVRSGVVRLVRMTADGRRLVSRFVWPKGLFGTCDGSERLFAAEAASDCEIDVFGRAAVAAAAARDSRVEAALYAGLAAEIVERDRAQLRATRLSADEALADFLLELAARQGGAVCHIPMMRSDIADHLGVTLETACRTLNRFHRVGLIFLVDPHRYAILDRPRIERLASGDRDAT